LLEEVAVAIALAGTGITAWQDYRTGYLSDKITISMILAGVVLTPFISPNPMQAYLVALAVFLTGFAGYAFGQIGGGDVLLFTGLALLVQKPLLTSFQAPYPPILSIFLLAGILGTMIFTPAKTHYRLAVNRKKVKSYYRKLGTGLLLALSTLPFFILYQSITSKIWLLFPAFALGFSVIPFKKDMIELFYVSMKPVSRIDEEEVLALEFIDPKIRKQLGIKRRTLIGKELERMKQLAKKHGVRKLPVCENLPVFVPAIFASLVLFLLFGDVFFYLILP